LSFRTTAAAYTQRVSPLIQQIEHHGVVFVLAYTEPLALGFEVKVYDPVRELEAALVRSVGKPIILFHHRPAVEDYFEYASSTRWSDPARAVL
jgi:hypothetical protein